MKVISKRLSPLIFSKTLETFLVVCEHRSFTVAAKILNLSQSAVSQNIHRLEDNLGLTLFDRQVRPIALRPEALLLQEQLQKQFKDIDTLVGQIREQQLQKSLIRIGVIESLAPYLALNLIKELSGKAKQITLLSGISSNIAGELLNRKVDIIISNSALDETSGLNRYRLFQEPHVLIFPKSSQTNIPKRPPQNWQELVSIALPMIFYSRRSALGKAIESQLKRLRLDIPVWIEADTNRVIFSLVAEGMGWAITTPLCLQQCPDMLDRLTIMPLPSPNFSRELHVITRQDEPTLLVESVLNECTKQLQSQIVPKLGQIAPWAAEQMVVTVAKG